MEINLGGGSRTAAVSKMELFVVIVNGFQPLTITQSTPNWMLQRSYIRFLGVIWILMTQRR